jgi:hypothetical protein
MNYQEWKNTLLSSNHSYFSINTVFDDMSINDFSAVKNMKRYFNTVVGVLDGRVMDMTQSYSFKTLPHFIKFLEENKDDFVMYECAYIRNKGVETIQLRGTFFSESMIYPEEGDTTHLDFLQEP